MSSAAAHLSVLNLRSNLKLENGAGRIFRALCSNSVLESVDVTCCGITAEVAPQLAELLELNTGLKVLKLGQNRLGDRGVEQLKDALALNQTLRVLDVSQCMIGFSGARALLTAVQMNRTLIGLDLQFNNVSPAFFRGIEAALQRNQSVLIPKEDVLHSAKPSAATSSPRTAFGPSAIQGMQTPPPFPPPSPPNAHAAVHSHPHRMASPVTTSPSSQSTGNASSSSSSSSGTTSAHTPSSPVNVSAFNELLKRHKKTIDRAESLLPASERGLLRDFLRFAQHAVHSLHDQRNAALSDASSALHDLQDQCQTLSTSLADRERTILELDSQCSQLQSAVEDLAAREQSLMTENAKLRQEVIDEREKRLDLLQQYMETSNLQGAGIIRYGSGSTAPANKKASISEVDLLKSENQLLIQALLEAQRKLASMHQES
jgi:prefoldin subunit 5